MDAAGTAASGAASGSDDERGAVEVGADGDVPAGDFEAENDPVVEPVGFMAFWNGLFASEEDKAKAAAAADGTDADGAAADGTDADKPVDPDSADRAADATDAKEEEKVEKRQKL